MTAPCCLVVEVPQILLLLHPPAYVPYHQVDGLDEVGYVWGFPADVGEATPLRLEHGRQCRLHGGFELFQKDNDRG